MSSQAYKEFRALLNKRAYNEALSFAERQSLRYREENEFWLTQQAVVLIKAKRYEEAIVIADRALARFPKNGYILLARADATLGVGQVDEALAYYEELSAHLDDKIVLRSHKGILNCVAQRKNWSKILSSLAEWKLPASEAMHWRVKALTGLGRKKEAMDGCHEWLRLNPDNPQALWQLTELEIAVEGLEAVRKRLARLAKIPSRPPIYREIYASLCRRAGRIDEAIEQYAKLSTSSAEFRIQSKQAFVLAKSGKEEVAIPIMEELLKVDPKDIYLHSAYAAACERIGELERALKFYQQLITLHPDAKTLYGRIKRIEKKLARIIQ